MIASNLQLRADRFSDRKAGHPNLPAAQTILGTIIGDSMKQIKLTQGQVTLVDDEDYKRLISRKWHATKLSYDGFAAVCTQQNKTTIMHRVITNAPKGKDVDHINHNTLDNRKTNLRVCTRSQNLRNRLKVRGISRYKGVTFFPKRNKKWCARIRYNSKMNHLGYYTTEKEAAIAYNKAAIEVFGDFANLNKLELL